MAAWPWLHLRGPQLFFDFGAQTPATRRLDDAGATSVEKQPYLGNTCRSGKRRQAALLNEAGYSATAPAQSPQRPTRVT